MHHDIESEDGPSPKGRSATPTGGPSAPHSRNPDAARRPDPAPQLAVHEHAPWQRTAADFFNRFDGGVRGTRDGGLIERVLLLAPADFRDKRTPDLTRILEEARQAVLAHTPKELEWHDNRHEVEREIHLAQRTLARRIIADPRLDPMLHWHGGDLIVGVPATIPGADHLVSARACLLHSSDAAHSRGERMSEAEIARCGEAAEWTEDAASHGIPATVWRCPLPSCYESTDPIVVEIAPNPRGFMNAMYIAHYGSAAIVAGFATGVGATRRLEGEPRRPVRLLPSGWSYMKPDRTQGMNPPCFPNGAPRPGCGVLVPDESLFLACARATWPVTLSDAVRVAFER